jgi:hypothetical protein
MRALQADWQRVALLREMMGANFPCMVDFGGEICPIPSVIAGLRLYHPGQGRDHRNAFPPRLLSMSNTTLLAHPSVRSQYREAASVATDVRAVVERERGAAMPVRFFATRAWAQWYYAFGSLNCDPAVNS